MKSLMIAFLFVSLPAMAIVNFPFHDPEFWTIAYNTPSSYRQCRIVVKAPDLDRARAAAQSKLAAFAAQDVSADAGGVTATVEAKRLDEACRSLLSLGEIINYAATDSTPPAYPELYYKRDRLRGEQAEVQDELARLRGITGLLAMELTTLDAIIGRHETASARGEISLTFTTGEPGAVAAPAGGRGFVRSGAVKRAHLLRSGAGSAVQPGTGGSADDPNYWNRSSGGDPCQRTPDGSAVAVEVRDLNAADARLARLEGFVPVASSCASREGGLVSASPTQWVRDVVVDVKRAPEIRRAILGLGQVLAWVPLSYAGGGDPGRTAAEKVRLLRDDSKAAAEMLIRAPHIAALVNAEILRLAPYAEAEERIRERVLFRVTLTPRPDSGAAPPR